MARYTVQSLHETHVQSSASSPATLTLSLTDQMTTDEACASDSKMPDIFMADGDNCYVPLIIIPDVNQGGEYDNDGVQFRCPVCSQGCPSRSKLEVHFRTHTDERPFECHQCGQSFRTQSSLIRHRKTHTDELQYACQEEDCERRFKFSGDLSRHMRTMHSEQRRFSCNFCTAKFKTNERCREHIRSHIPGQKPYRCSLCPMSFVNSSKLRIHTRTHTGDKPFRCKEEDCDAAFVDSAGLVKHRRTHLPKDVMLYWCEVCGKGYRHSPTLGKHRRTEHPELEAELQRRAAEDADGAQQCHYLAVDSAIHAAPFTVPIVFDTTGTLTHPTFINIDDVSTVGGDPPPIVTNASAISTTSVFDQPQTASTSADDEERSFRLSESDVSLSDFFIDHPFGSSTNRTRATPSNTT